tara:strand:+ start:603 stop:851 length:249 start_codon:yes stop_codon:yes gene_type:complete
VLSTLSKITNVIGAEPMRKSKSFILNMPRKMPYPKVIMTRLRIKPEDKKVDIKAWQTINNTKKIELQENTKICVLLNRFGLL